MSTVVGFNLHFLVLIEIGGVLGGLDWPFGEK